MNVTTNMNTENKDFTYFKSKFPEWLKDHKGQFVLIRDEKEHGFYSDSKSALEAGLSKFGNEPFLVQEITDELRNNYIASHLVA